MDAKELYLFRAEEFERNFHALRDIESRNSLEVFTGYAVIGIAHFQLDDKYPHNSLLGFSALLLVFSLFAIALYHNLRTQERLRFIRNMKDLYIKKLHELCAAPELEVPADLPQPTHGFWWAFAAHIALSAITMVALAAYIIGTTWPHQ